jgi:hypothetical protein
MKTNKLLAIIVVLQGLILMGQWTGHGYLPSAQAQVPDPANRQMQMIEELKSANAKLEQIVSILQGGDLQVKVVKSEENKGAPARGK